MSKTYQVETRFFEFLQYTNKDELKIKQRSQFAMALLEWLRCNGFVATALLFWFLLLSFTYVYKTVTIFLDNELY